MRQALQRMASLHASLTAEADRGSLDVSEGAERASARRSLELLRRGLLSAGAFADVLQRISESARESAARLDAMPLPPDREGLMAQIMTTSREAMTDVVKSALALREAGLSSAWEKADAALAELEDAQLFLARIGRTGS